MGDRASVSFRKGDDESVVLCSHWGGRGFQDAAQRHVDTLRAEVGDKEVYPLDRLEPDTVMVDFIRAQTVGLDRVKSDLYLAATTVEVDNSDHGHRTIRLEK